MINRIKRVCRKAFFKAPYLLPYVGKIDFREATDDLPTMSVNADGVVRYNPEFVRKLPEDELAGSIAHEILHLMSSHVDRQGTRDGKLWNVATDMAINHILREGGLTLPPKALFPPYQFAGKSAETIYKALDESGYKPEPEPTLANGCGVDRGKGEMSNMQRAMEWRQMANDVLASMPGSVQKDALLGFVNPPPPKANYANLLRGALSQARVAAGRDDMSFTRRNRRSPQDIILPGWIARQAVVASIIDVSGSMSDDMVAQCISETMAMQKANRDTDIYLILHDVKVVWSGWIRATQPDKIGRRINSRGGTSFEDAYNNLGKAGRFDCAVHLTDGEVMSWPEIPKTVRRFIIGHLGGSVISPPKHTLVLPIDFA